MADRATQGLLERLVMAGAERFFQDFGAGTLARHGASLRTLAELQEVSEDVGPELSVLDLWMELKAKEGPVAVSHRLDVAVLGACEGYEVPRELGDLVIMGLPHLEPIRETFEEDVGLVDLHDGLAELRNLGRGCVAPEVLRHELVSRADSQDGGVERVQVLPVPAHLSRIHPDPVDSPDLVRDPDRDAVEDLMGDFRVHRSHAVDRVDRTDRDRLTVHAKIPVNADRLHRQEDGEVLPRKGHEAAAGRGLDLFLDDGGRASDEGHPIRRHFSDHPNRESWPGKRLALRDPHPERPGDCPDLVLVEVAQRFDELQLHVLREPADIVVGLDPIPELASALDPVRGDRPLDQVVGPVGLRLSLEELDELPADDGPLLLRVDDAPQGREEFVRGVDNLVPHAEFLQRLRDVLGLSFPHEPGVDVDREKAIFEGATREDHRRGAVDPTRTGDDRLARHGLADGLGLFGDESGRVEHHSPSVRESSSTHFFNASRCSLSLSTSRSSRNARISTARMAAFSPRSRPTAATGTPGGICETLRTASRFSLPLTGTPITGFVVWAAIVPGSAAERPAIAMKTLAVVFRIKSRRRSGVRWADAPTRLVPALYGPAYHAQKTPTTKPPTRSPTPILRLFPLPKYAVKAPVITRKSAKVKSKIVTNVNGSNASNGIDVLLKI